MPRKMRSKKYGQKQDVPAEWYRVVEVRIAVLQQIVAARLRVDTAPWAKRGVGFEAEPIGVALPAGVTEEGDDDA